MNFNSRNTYYKTPFGAVKCGESIRLRFPIAEWVPVNRVLVYLRKGDSSTPMEMSYEGRVDGHSIYELTFKAVSAGIYFYRFEMHNRDGIWYYGRGEGGECVCGDNLPEWQLTVCKASYKTPEFAKGGVIYHIFVDRFNRAKGVVTKRNYRLHDSWDEDPEVVSPDGKYYADDFFGGNFKGIEEKLPYLKNLGVTILYLSPVFEAFSNHRYDTGDYLKVDELLGSEDDFKSLIKSAKDMGISVILDGVFNHSGADSRYFNKFGRYDTVGAYQSKNSPYYSWYYFKKFPNEYACWWGCDNVPDLNKSNEGYRHLVFGVGGVIDKWTSAGVKGWRLDVVDELPIDFTYRLCETIKRMNKNALIIGEVWEDASTKVSYGEMRPYLLGDQLDGTMNYPFKDAVIKYMFDGNAVAFKEAVMTIVENYPKETLDCAMNLIGTHDTARIITTLSGVNAWGWSKSDKRAYRMPDDLYNVARERVKLASAMQFTLPGIPSVYYGDEAGLQGFEDPNNRRPYPWGKEDKELLAHYEALGKIRRDNKEIFTGDFEFVRTDNLLIYKRFSDAGEILTIINCGDTGVTHTFNKVYTNLINGTLYNKDTEFKFSARSCAIIKRIDG